MVAEKGLGVNLQAKYLALVRVGTLKSKSSDLFAHLYVRVIRPNIMKVVKCEDLSSKKKWRIIWNSSLGRFHGGNTRVHWSLHSKMNDPE